MNMVKEHKGIFWQAHRGGGGEAPDNTIAANRYTWSLGGIPEADIRTTRDNIIICLHDETLARTTMAPDIIKHTPVSALDYESMRYLDVGAKFGQRFFGERVPQFEEVLKEMQDKPERQLYIDLKDADLLRLGELIERYGVMQQIIFTHNLQESCIRMKTVSSSLRTMLWIGGNAEDIMRKFREVHETGFRGLDQVQLHLNRKIVHDDWIYELDPGFLQSSLADTASFDIDLEVFPFELDAHCLYQLLNMGIYWFATDEPGKLTRYLE